MCLLPGFASSIPSKSVNECKQRWYRVRTEKNYLQVFHFHSEFWTLFVSSLSFCAFQMCCCVFSLSLSLCKKEFYQFSLIHLYSFQVIYFLNARLNSVIDTHWAHRSQQHWNCSEIVKSTRSSQREMAPNIENTSLASTVREGHTQWASSRHGVFVFVQSNMEAEWKTFSRSVEKCHPCLSLTSWTWPNKSFVGSISKSVVNRARISQICSKSIEHDLLLFTFHLTAIENIHSSNDDAEEKSGRVRERESDREWVWEGNLTAKTNTSNIL